MYFGNLSCVNPLKCISMKNQECKVRPEIIVINSNDPIFYPFSIKTNKCISVYCICDGKFYNFYWNYYLFCLLQLVFQ